MATGVFGMDECVGFAAIIVGMGEIGGISRLYTAVDGVVCR